MVSERNGVSVILVVDDDELVLKTLRILVSSMGYHCLSAPSAVEAVEILKKTKCDLVLSDLSMPDMDGIELLANLRRDSDVYVIMLSARTEETDKIVGLSVGADDYLSKPFSPRELLARIKAALRRIQKTNLPEEHSPDLQFAHIRINQAERRVWVNDQLIELTAVEFDLLTHLAQHHGHVLSRQQLLEKVWGYDYFGDTRVVDVHLGHIRQKLGDEQYIQTIRGVGYRFEDK